LERLYLVEHLSAAKIARIYELKYKTPKVAESVVLYQLKKNGIPRRDSADHIRKVASQTVDEWVTRYQAGESLKQIAGDAVSPVTVWLHLRKCGVQLRDKVEAQIKAVSRYGRRPFRGSRLERAYLVGLRLGDLDVVRHGRAVRIRVSTTHPAMAELFENLFGPYGHIAHYPRTSPFTGYEWTLECDLDPSFEFLLVKASLKELESMPRDEFGAFLAGFFDAEGSIFLHEKSSGYAPEVRISNTDRVVLKVIHRRLTDAGVHSKIHVDQQDSMRLGHRLEGVIWRIDVWRFESVRLFLGNLCPRHREKAEKSRLALLFVAPLSERQNALLISEWEKLASSIKGERNLFVKQAEQALTSAQHR